MPAKFPKQKPDSMPAKFSETKSEHDFAAAVQALRPRLRRIAAKIVGFDEAEDVVQNTIAAVWFEAQAGRVRDVGARLLTSVQDDARDYVKARSRHVSVVAYYDREAVRPPPVDEDGLVTQIEVRRALTNLPADIRHAVWAVFALDATWQEAADDLNVERKTLFKRVQKWMPYLREQLGFQTSPASSSLLGEDERDGCGPADGQ